MNDKQLKHLAEKHFFLGKKLTIQEESALRSSKYADIVKVKSSFESLYEQVIDDAPAPRQRKKSYKHHFYTGVNKRDLIDLLDDIEMEFDLDINNGSPNKYASIDLQELKQFILRYASKNLLDDTTQAVVNKITTPEASITDIFHTLYSHTY